MNNDIYLIGEVGEEITLDSVIKKVEASDKTKPLNVSIHSAGGSVFEGLAIYNYLKGLEQQVNTSSAGMVASVASIFFLAGKKETRKTSKVNNFLIHLPKTQGKGDASELQKQADQLLEIEDTFSKIYSLETNLTEIEALELMRKDEFLEASFLLEKGFVSEITEFKAVAKFNKNQNKMSNLTNEDKGFFQKAFAKIEALLDKDPQAKLVTDANGTELDFTDLADDATPKVGDKATVDGSPADGEYTMPSDDVNINGQIYVFVSGDLTEIKPVETNNADALKAENEDLKKQIETLKAEATTTGETVAKLEKQFNKIKAKLGSNFEYVGKTNTKKTEAKASRSFHGTKKD